MCLLLSDVVSCLILSKDTIGHHGISWDSMKHHETEKARTCFQEMIDGNNVCEALSRFCSVRYGCRSRLGNKMLSTWLGVCVNVWYGGEIDG